VFAFVDRPAPARWFAEWEEIFALEGPPRRQPSANGGFVAFSKRHVPALLDRWAESVERLAARMVSARSAGYGDPLWLSDQDALNAQLMSVVPADRIAWGPPSGMAIGDSLAAARVVDARRLRCTWQGEPVTVLHAIGRPKPWQPAVRWRYRRNAYARCLRRALTGPDVAIRIPESDLVPWLRSGVVGAATGTALHALYTPVRTSRPFRRRLGLSPVRRRAR
jgi:hypothetical protein